MKIGPKYKICKRLGSGVFDKCQTQKFMLAEQQRSKQRGGKRPKALSDFGRQLLEKQRARFSYGITERQLANYAKGVNVRLETEPNEQLLSSLEGRLDNVVYRAGFAPTRRMARQLVAHGHITVNGRRLSIPSHRVTSGDVIGVREGSKQKGPFASIIEHGVGNHPTWLSVDAKALTAHVAGVPSVARDEVAFDPSLVLEYYSR